MVVERLGKKERIFDAREWVNVLDGDVLAGAQRIEKAKRVR